MGSIFGYKTEVVTHNKHTLKNKKRVFMLTGTVSNERKIMFFIVMYCCYGIFLQS